MLRVQIRDALRERIIRGQLQPCEPLREEALSQEFGVSRTPVREALAQLEQEGMVEFQTCCGFRVAPLSIEEMEEVFPIIGSLQSLALQAGGIPSDDRLRGLRAMNHVLGKGDDPRAIVLEDIHWHGLLLADCRSKRLLNILTEVESIVHRYDLAHFTEGGDANASIRQHHGILDALESGHLKEACRRLEAHWLGGMDWMRVCIERMNAKSDLMRN